MTVEQLRWARIGAAASGAGEVLAGHKHAFWRDGAEKRFVEVEVARKGDRDGAVARVAGGLRDLLGAQDVFIFYVFHTHPHLRRVDPRRFYSAQVDRISI